MNLNKVLTVEEQRFKPDEWGMPGFEDRHIRSPLIHSGLVETVQSFYFSEHTDIDTELYNYCVLYKPDLILLTVQFCKTVSHLPSEWVISRIVAEFNVSIVMFWFDIHAEIISSIFQRYSSFATLNVLFCSSPASHISFDFVKCNYVYAGLTFDENVFSNRDLYQDIDIGFFGTLYPDRCRYIDILKANHFNVFTAGGIMLNGCRSLVDSKGLPLWVPYTKYLELIQRTKIVLNFSTLPNMRYQMRGRVFEVLWCTSFLLEEDNPVISEYFTPCEDYASFTGVSDLINKLHMYLFNSADRDRIRYQGRSTVEKYYNTKRFWGNLLEVVHNIRTNNLSCRSDIWNCNYFDNKTNGVVYVE